MFFDYSAVLNGYDTNATSKMTVNKHTMNRLDFEDSVLMPMREDQIDHLRNEYNGMILGKSVGSNGAVFDRYVTVSVVRKNIDEARRYFAIITETTEMITTLYITVTHQTAEDMADVYGFTPEQKQILSELLQEDNASMWSAALYGIHSADEQIVAVAESQIGNVGGEPYWRWYGFSSRVEWCACFVSWCANECGYIEAGVIPRFSVCDRGVEWFQERGHWADGTATPVPGMIIFYDWDSPDEPSGPQDGESDHVGIVQKVEDGYVYCIEGNAGDACIQTQRRVGHYEILGYGIVGN